MGICNVLAIVPFLCSAPPEEPPQEEQAILSAPSEDVEVNTLTAPDGNEFAPAAPAMRSVSDYEVLPPSESTDVAYDSRPALTGNADEQASSFSDWVNQNWGDEDQTGDETSDQ